MRHREAADLFVEYPPPYDANTNFADKTAMTTQIPRMYGWNAALGQYDVFSGTVGAAVDRSRYGLKKRNNVPGFVVMAGETLPYTPLGVANNGRYLDGIDAINPLRSGYGTGTNPKGYAGMPHGTKTNPTSNILMVDGSLATVNLARFNDVPNFYSVDGRDWYFESTTARANIYTQTTLR